MPIRKRGHAALRFGNAGTKATRYQVVREESRERFGIVGFDGISQRCHYAMPAEALTDRRPPTIVKHYPARWGWPLEIGEQLGLGTKWRRGGIHAVRRGRNAGGPRVTVRPRLTVLLFGVGAAGAAAAAWTVEPAGYLDPSLQLAIDVAQVLSALVAAYLIGQRAARTGSLVDLGILFALLVIAFSSVFFAHPFVAFGEGPDVASRLAGTCSIVAAGVLALACLRGHARVPRSAPAVVTTIAMATATVALAGWALSSSVAGALGSTGSADVDRVVPMLLMFALLGIAMRLTMLAEAADNESLGWFAAGALVAAFALPLDLVVRFTQRGAVGLEDGLVVVAFGLFVIGGQRDLAVQRDTNSMRAALNERRRLARELHDGLTQELLFISSQGRRLMNGSVADGERLVRQLAGAADRAAEEARGAISDLIGAPHETVDEGVARVAGEIAERAGIALDLDLYADVRIDPDAHHAVLRIVREAVVNAVKHSGSGTISVRLRSMDAGVVLDIVDDGCGFDRPHKSSRGGFGLTSMNERAAAIGARCEIVSARGAGTMVRVVLPLSLEWRSRSRRRLSHRRDAASRHIELRASEALRHA